MTVLTYADELERKTLETVELLVLRHQQGVYDNRTFRIAFDAVWGATSGLVDAMMEFQDDVVAMKLASEQVQNVVSNGDSVFIVGRNGVNVSVIDAKTFAESNFKVFGTEAEAAEHAAKLVGAFSKKGFKKL